MRLRRNASGRELVHRDELSDVVLALARFTTADSQYVQPALAHLFRATVADTPRRAAPPTDAGRGRSTYWRRRRLLG